MVSSGSFINEKGAGVLIMVHSSLCNCKDLRFNEVIPGRLLHTFESPARTLPWMHSRTVNTSGGPRAP